MIKNVIDESFRIPEEHIEIYCIPNAIDPGLCETIIECIDKYCVPSTVTTGREMTQSSVRKSSTCRLEEWPDYKFSVNALQEAILKITGLDWRYSEPLQGQKYKIGDFYQRHTDFFTPKTITYDSFTKHGGQRTWTTMVYLNDVINGGATFFPTIELAIAPTRGSMLVWDNMNTRGKENFYSMHEALPPVSNPKYIVTQWFRQKYYR